MDINEYLHDTYNKENKKSPIKLLNFNRNDLAVLFNKLEFEEGAEIGVEKGKYASALFKRIPDLHLLAIDSWDYYFEYTSRLHVVQDEEDRFHAETKERLANCNVEIIKAYSMDAVKKVYRDSLDFVYIDANHEFDYIIQDIIEWTKRVKPGGIVAGHDYYIHRWTDVIEAVDMYVKMHNIKEWFLTDERSASWFFVKQ